MNEILNKNECEPASSLQSLQSMRLAGFRGLDSSYPDLSYII